MRFRHFANLSPRSDRSPSPKKVDSDQHNQVTQTTNVFVHSLLADRTDCCRLEGNGFSPPLGYRTPSWPSLYWPFGAPPNVPQYLYYATGIPWNRRQLSVDIWLFTLFWTFAIFGVVFLVAGLWAWSVYFLKTKWAVLIPILYVVSGEFIALVSGTIVGRPSTPFFVFRGMD